MLRSSSWLPPVWAALSLLVLHGCSHASAPPLPRDAPGIDLHVSAGNRFVKAYENAEITALVRVQAERVERGERPPANIALLVDTSGSMEGRAIEDARAASLSLLGALGPKDRLAVVVFHAKTEVLLPSTPLDDAYFPELRARISRMKAQGTTDMAGGLRAALAEVERNYDPRAVNRIVLLGDGAPNDAAPIEATLAEAAQRRIAVTSLGLGAEYNESLMGHIALATGGRFHYVADSAKVAAFFEQEVARVHDACARNARLVLTPGPGVIIDAVVGQETVASGAGVELSLGDLSYGDRRDVIVKAHAASHRDGSAVEVLDAKLAFAEGDSGDALEKSAYLGVRATTDAEQVAKGHDADVEKEAARMEEAAKTVESIKDRERSHEAPSPSPTYAAPATPAAASPPAVKEAHDRAVDVLQSY